MAQTKRKKFFDVKVPSLNKEIWLIGYNLEDLNGRTIKYDLTRLLKGKSTLAFFTVKVEKDKAYAVPKKIQILPFFLRRIVRKGTSYIEDSFSTNCKNAQTRIKPILITRRKVSRAIKKALREKAKEFLIEYCKNKTYEQIFDDILKGKIQKPVNLILKKIYPLSFCDIRIFEVEGLKEKSKK